jgi:hypothetical protein
MGQTMACCGNNDKDNNEIKTNNDFNNKFSKLAHPDKVALIVKI